MRVFIAGATGVLGRALVRQFVARGHTVLGLARTDKNARLIESLGGRARAADMFDADSLAHAAEGADAVVHAATSIPTKSRTKAEDWETNDRLRRDGTRSLTACAAKIGTKIYLQQSIVWLARPADGSFFDESTEPRPDAVTQSALDAEKIAAAAVERHGFKAAVLRCGLFYGPAAAHTRMMGRMLLKRRLPVVGKGTALLSCLHTEDAAGAFVAAAEGARSGLWHVVDDEAVAVKELLAGFAERLNAPAPRRVPVWLARLVAGRTSVEFFTSSTHTSNAKFRADFNWSPRFPGYREGLDQVVSAWKAEGFLN
ncbi:MAG TPA: NAD-dependent epimerase/dehydratase family protein [Pyrinomonadaceae bacterium]|nr:NAD-dependent epimerase/dehydratase family protein [Pyrinomonadaceae bacterium]